MDYVTGLSLVMVILIEDVLLCNVQSVMQCFEGFEFTAANLCLEVKKFEDCVAPLADKCKDNAVYNTYVNQLKIFKPSCGGSSGAVCDVMGLQKCMAEVEYAEGVDLRDNCARFEECTQPLIAQCGDNDPQYMNIKSSIDSFRHVCASSDLSSAQCDLQAAMNCLTGFQQAQSAESTNTAATCSSFQKAMTCLAPIKENCNSDENLKSSFAMLTSVESMCAGGAECTGSLQKCYVDAGIDTTGGSMPEPTCEDAKTLQTCVKGLSTVCEGNYAYDQSKTSLQDVVAKCTNLASAQCDLQAAMGCVTGFQQEQSAGSTDVAAVCSSFQKAMTCLAPIKENCNSDEGFQNIMTMLNSVESMCAGGAECTGNLQKCYMDAGIDTTGDSTPELTCEDAKTVQMCLISLSTVCEGNFAYGMSKTSVQDEVANCTAKCNYIMECNLDYTFPNGIPSKPDYETGCSAIECVESKYKWCFTDKAMESSIKKMKAFCMDANLKNGLETYKDCLANSTINKDCKGHLTPKIETGGNETEAEECMRIEEYAMCAKKGVMSCDNEGVQVFAADTARKVIMLKASREGGIECSTSAGFQVFSSFVLILAAALLTFAKAY